VDEAGTLQGTSALGCGFISGQGVEVSVLGAPGAGEFSFKLLNSSVTTFSSRCRSIAISTKKVISADRQRATKSDHNEILEYFLRRSDANIETTGGIVFGFAHYQPFLTISQVYLFVTYYRNNPNCG
jgi:hypothetical protein